MNRESVTCPKCGGKARVVDAVMVPDDNERYRKKCCIDCSHIFYTIEFEVEADMDFLENWYTHHRNRNRKMVKKEKQDIPLYAKHTKKNIMEAK